MAGLPSQRPRALFLVVHGCTMDGAASADCTHSRKNCSADVAAGPPCFHRPFLRALLCSHAYKRAVLFVDNSGADIMLGQWSAACRSCPWKAAAQHSC